MAEERTTPLSSSRGATASRRLAAALTLLAWLAIFYTLYFAGPILIPVVLAVLLAFALSPVVRAMESLAVPRPLAAFLVVTGLLTSLGYGLAMLGEPAAEWFSEAPGKLRSLEPELRSLREPVDAFREASDGVEELAELKPQGDVIEVRVEQRSFLDAVLSGTPRLFASTIASVFFLFFLLAAGERLTAKLSHIFPRLLRIDDLQAVGTAVEREISRYLLTISIINLSLGLIVGAWLWVLGIDNALLWGLLAGLFNFAPYLGALASLVLLTVVALLQYELSQDVLLVAGGYLLLSTLEGQLLTPLLVGRRLAISPYIIFLAIMLFGWLWGLAGVLMAVPILVCLKIVGRHVPGAEILERIITREDAQLADPEPSNVVTASRLS